MIVGARKETNTTDHISKRFLSHCFYLVTFEHVEKKQMELEGEFLLL